MFLETTEAYVEMARRRWRSRRSVRIMAHALSAGSGVIAFGACFALWADVTRSPLTFLLAVTGIGIALLTHAVSVILWREAKGSIGVAEPIAKVEAHPPRESPVPAE